MIAADLWRMSRRELVDVMASGADIDPDAIADKEYRGVSLGLGALVERLTWKTFRKVFCRDEAGGVRGWNVRIEQTGLAPPFRPRTRGGRPESFGHYEVELAPRGLCLDYGRYAGALDPLRFVRDPLVAVRRDDPTLLVGTTLLALPGVRVATPSFFTLELDGPLSLREPAPRR